MLLFSDVHVGEKCESKQSYLLEVSRGADVFALLYCHVENDVCEDCVCNVYIW